MKIFGYELKKFDGAIPLNAGEGSPTTKRKTAGANIAERMKFRSHEDIATLEDAISNADNYLLYNREELHKIYLRVSEDLHLTSQWETRKMKVKEKDFRIVGKDDEEDLELTKLFESGWFLDAIDHALDSKLYGHSLIEFGEWKEGKFRDFKTQSGEIRESVSIIDRDYVKPEWGLIVPETYDTKGVDYTAARWRKQLIAVGRPHNFGLMLKCAKPYLFKDNCLSNWSEWSEVFGMDMRIGKTTADGEDRKKFLATLRDLGSNGYGVVNTDESIDYMGVSRQDAFRVYDALIRYVDSSISKGIFGQDVISNNTGQVIGKTGENVSNMYGANDAVFIKNFVNDKLIPLMIENGVTALTDKWFKWDSTEKLTLEQRSQIDLRISQMGKQIEDEYIRTTYGMEVAQRESPLAVAQSLKKLYE
jgi:phage gp29-like protein